MEAASSALDAACRLLDRQFGNHKWRQEWTIAEAADRVRREAFGYPSFEDAEAEAERRGPNWSARFDAKGAAIVTNDYTTNALIDAAPELLAALREALHAAKLATIHEHPDTADNLPWYAAGLAAIAKAEGRS
ncbi:MAG TPA: hypothetical protein PLF81_22405 [Candidatus Anammoximicrobium sp.]|nr:hypothetical protein [Candidatus Anammoximicrobium sp.]